MAEPAHPFKILVLEDEILWQSIIFGVSDNEGFECEIVPSIAEFTEIFKKGLYKAVILDNLVKDGEALGRANLVLWIREEDPEVKIAFNSSSAAFSKLAETVGAWNICKDPMELRNFLREML